MGSSSSSQYGTGYRWNVWMSNKKKKCLTNIVLWIQPPKRKKSGSVTCWSSIKFHVNLMISVRKSGFSFITESCNQKYLTTHTISHVPYFCCTGKNDDLLYKSIPSIKVSRLYATALTCGACQWTHTFTIDASRDFLLIPTKLYCHRPSSHAKSAFLWWRTRVPIFMRGNIWNSHH